MNPTSWRRNFSATVAGRQNISFFQWLQSALYRAIGTSHRTIFMPSRDLSPAEAELRKDIQARSRIMGGQIVLFW
ncbi:hypothetical protein EA797_11640 [Stutzerimonas zhaodongensis]|uniref:Uncharacterized protein n=1 Tax=Stutzerimonas zhaodongensis TaxID=1176257 RepID=A0A3M2HKA4_9GAMM|nr:hypothetical protein [Stutzerimonas zhaodongensis]MCQ4315276.1 hypothetical protein [Stutzerimonas zhaodongensis]RMH90156.1 hypothetical protein EA797_11640 [Stutzerimonas zhaodongensis]